MSSKNHQSIMRRHKSVNERRQIGSYIPVRALAPDVSMGLAGKVADSNVALETLLPGTSTVADALAEVLPVIGIAL